MPWQRKNVTKRQPAWGGSERQTNPPNEILQEFYPLPLRERVRVRGIMQATVMAGALDGASFDSRNNLLREHFHGLPIINNRLDRDLMNAGFLHVLDRLHNLIRSTG